jgi:hypothetical protein
MFCEAERHTSYTAIPTSYDDATQLGGPYFCTSPVSAQAYFAPADTLSPPPLAYNPPRRPVSHLFDRITSAFHSGVRPGTAGTVGSRYSQISDKSDDARSWFDAIMSLPGQGQGYTEDGDAAYDGMDVTTARAAVVGPEERPIWEDGEADESMVTAPEAMSTATDYIAYYRSTYIQPLAPPSTAVGVEAEGAEVLVDEADRAIRDGGGGDRDSLDTLHSLTASEVFEHGVPIVGRVGQDPLAPPIFLRASRGRAL